MRKVWTGTIQRRRDGMMIDTGKISVYVPAGHDGGLPPAGTLMRVILEPASLGGFTEPFTTDSGQVLDPLAATIIQEIGMYAPPSDVLEQIRDYLTDRLDQRREMCEHMTADKVPGELLEGGPLIPEFPVEMADEQCIKYGWWDLLEHCVFEAGRAEQLREYWTREGFDVRFEHVFGDGRTDDQFFRLWFRGKKAV